MGTDGYTLIEDESIVNVLASNWHTQQIVKSSFWKLNLCENYVCLDSDSYFVRDFFIKDFMYDDKIPYTVMHEQKELFEWSVKYIQQHNQIITGYNNDRIKIMTYFKRSSKLYDFGPSPTIWNREVWSTLNDKYLAPNYIEFADLIQYCPSEFTWYGEFMLYSKIIPFRMCSPLFKVFHYKQQYIDYIETGYTLDMVKENYLGIVMQSNWYNI